MRRAAGCALVVVGFGAVQKGRTDSRRILALTNEVDVEKEKNRLTTLSLDKSRRDKAVLSRQLEVVVRDVQNQRLEFEHISSINRRKILGLEGESLYFRVEAGKARSEVAALKYMISVKDRALVVMRESVTRLEGEAVTATVLWAGKQLDLDQRITTLTADCGKAQLALEQSLQKGATLTDKVNTLDRTNQELRRAMGLLERDRAQTRAQSAARERELQLQIDKLTADCERKKQQSQQRRLTETALTTQVNVLKTDTAALEVRVAAVEDVDQKLAALEVGRGELAVAQKQLALDKVRAREEAREEALITAQNTMRGTIAAADATVNGHIVTITNLNNKLTLVEGDRKAAVAEVAVVKKRLHVCSSELEGLKKLLEERAVELANMKCQNSLACQGASVAAAAAQRLDRAMDEARLRQAVGLSPSVTSILKRPPHVAAVNAVVKMAHTPSSRSR